MTTTETPRTDSVVSEPCAIHEVMQKWEKIIENSRQLERELAASLKNQLKNESDLLQSQDINSFLDTEFRIACKRAEKAEAEVKRLRKQLQQAVEIAVNLSWDYADTEYDDELDQLKATLNHTQK